MTVILWITATILMLHGTHSYILLTANLDDVNAIARQLIDSPVADQLKSIWRRASNHFSTLVSRTGNSGYKNRAKEDYDSGEERQERDDGADQDLEKRVERRQGEDAPGNNSSFYLNFIKKIIKDI